MLFRAENRLFVSIQQSGYPYKMMLKYYSGGILTGLSAIIIINNVLVKQNCNTFPKKSSHPFLPRCKTVVERVRSDGIIPEQNIIVNVSEQFIFGAI